MFGRCAVKVDIDRMSCVKVVVEIRDVEAKYKSSKGELGKISFSQWEHPKSREPRSESIGGTPQCGCRLVKERRGRLTFQLLDGSDMCPTLRL